MVTATIARDGTSVDIELLASGSGTPLVSRDHGKPNLEIQSTGAINPRHIDQWSGLETYNLTGLLTGSTAYTDAITLLDLIKSNSNGKTTTLNIGMSEFDDDINVVPAAGSDTAATVNYNPGWTDYLPVDLTLTRVSEVASGQNQPASTPTATGTGPVQLKYQGTEIDLTDNVTVSRSVGRPQSVVRRVPNDRYPRYRDKYKTAYDAFDLSFRITEATITTVNQIVDMFSQQLGRNSLTLDFNGLYGMGAFNVVPIGSGALRTQRQSGREGMNNVPTIQLRRVL
jgi:hypothetical protein